MFCGDKNVLHHKCIGGCITVHICQVTELYTKNWGILLYGNYTTIKCIFYRSNKCHSEIEAIT